MSVKLKINKLLTKKRGTSFKWNAATTLVAIIILLFLYQKGIISIAFINGEPVTVGEAARVLTSKNTDSALDTLVAQKIIEYEAKKQNIIVSAEEIRRKVSFYQKQAKLQGTTVLELMQMEDTSLENIDENVKLQITLYKLIAEKDVSVSEAEIDEFFDEWGHLYTEEEKELYKDEIIQFLYSEKLSQSYETWIREAKAESEVKYFIDF
jgi:hypothetical protein